MSASAGTLPDTWHKVHDEYLETLLHRATLMVASPGDDDPLARPEVIEHSELMRHLATELAGLGAAAPLEQLVAVAGLSSVEREAVALALACEFDPSLARGMSGAESRVDGISPATLAALLGLTAVEAATLSDSSSPLTRFGLTVVVSPSSAAIERPLRLADRTLAFLADSGSIDDSLRGLITFVEPVPLPADLTEVAHDLATWLVSEERGAGPVLVDLVGHVGTGRAALAAHVATDLGMGLLTLDVERLAGRADRLDLARVILRELLLLPAALYIVDRAGTSDDPARRAALTESIDAIEGLLFVGSERRSTSGPTATISMPDLSRIDRAVLWQELIGDTDLDIDTIADQFRFGPHGIARVVSDAHRRADITRRPLDEVQLRAACRAEAGAGLSEMAQHVDARVGWDRLVLGSNERELLRSLCDHVRHRAKVYEDWGVGEASARGLGTSALFTGPSGTGKTLAAEVIATELDLGLYRIDLASVVSKYIGETEKNLRSVFDAAEQGGAILFFDEADALFGKRSEVKDSHDRYANIEINYLLQRMETHRGLSILATNRKTDLDQAFLRRIRFVVPFAVPRAPARRAIWEVELAAGMPLADIDLDALARLELAGGNIRNVVVNGAFAAAAGGTRVTTAHLIRAASHEYVKLDKLPTRGEFGEWYDEVVR